MGSDKVYMAGNERLWISLSNTQLEVLFCNCLHFNTLLPTPQDACYREQGKGEISTQKAVMLVWEMQTLS